jgi:hypothetical protein
MTSKMIFGFLFLAPLVMGNDAFGRDKTLRNNATGNIVDARATDINFEDAAISGRMKAPQGFFLQGKNTQRLSQMVKLRSSFKKQLHDSISGIRSLKH